MYISRLEISNLRSIEHAVLELNRPRSRKLRCPNVNVLLGDNGSGKTTVLRAAALAALAPVLGQSSGFVPDGLMRRLPQLATEHGAKPRLRIRKRITKGTAIARVRLDHQDLIRSPKQILLEAEIHRIADSERVEWIRRKRPFERRIERAQYGTKTSAFFLVGYGASRRVELSERIDESARLKSRMRRYERVAGLFEEHVALVPLSYWLPDYERRNPGRHKEVVNLMNRLLPAACRMQLKASETATGRENLFDINGVSVPFRALSDGYRAYVGWIGDMLFHLCMGSPSGRKLVQNRGVVLVDEIDLHLHPDWQRIVVPTLAKELPNIQFIVTTHSPLVVGSLQAENLFVLAMEERCSIVRRLPEPVHGMSAEQILLSPYFGLETTRSPEVADNLRKLVVKAQKGDAKASVRYLKLLAGGKV